MEPGREEVEALLARTDRSQTCRSPGHPGTVCEEVPRAVRIFTAVPDSREPMDGAGVVANQAVVADGAEWVVCGLRSGVVSPVFKPLTPNIDQRGRVVPKFIRATLSPLVCALSVVPLGLVAVFEPRTSNVDQHPCLSWSCCTKVASGHIISNCLRTLCSSSGHGGCGA